MTQIAFRRLSFEDLATVFVWLSRPHVRKWYAPEPTSFAEVVAKYGPRTSEDNPVKAFIVQVDGEDAGYVQAYSIDVFPDYEARLACEKGVVGMDLFLGEPERTGRGLGPQVILRFVQEFVFGAYGATACVAGPQEGNRASIRAFEKAGFTSWKRIDNERGERECVMRLERDHAGYRIETIDLLDAERCAEYHRAMYLESFGTDEGLDREMGVENAVYLKALRRKLAQFPEGNAHLWHGGRIVGQLEMRLVDHEPHVGYLSLLYVEPALRGRGLGRLLHEHAALVCRNRGMRLMRLSVSIANVPAMVFYRKLGWVVAGRRPNVRPMAIMEFTLE